MTEEREGKWCEFCTPEYLEKSHRERIWIEPGWSFHSYEGWVAWRDPDTKLVRHRHNIDFKPKQQGKSEPSLSGSKLADALIAVVEDPMDEGKASKARELIIRQAASVATKGGAQAMTALSNLGTLIDEAFGKIKPPQPHQRCPVCKRDETKPIEMTIDSHMCNLLAFVQLREDTWNRADVPEDVKARIREAILLLEGDINAIGKTFNKAGGRPPDYPRPDITYKDTDGDTL